MLKKENLTARPTTRRSQSNDTKTAEPVLPD
jgi:hypothetical protein